eukprot:jgi/Orpsp1_1/1174359/evm.model.c7180000049804.1
MILKLLIQLLLILHYIHYTFGLSFRCKFETQKYNKCIKDIQFNYSGGSSEITEFCKHFERSECKSFLKDIEISSTKCNYDNNEADYLQAHKLFELKRNYLFFCSTYNGNSQWQCPLTTYSLRIADSYFSNYAYEIVEMKDMKIILDEPEVLEYNCRISECNRLFLILNDHINLLHKMDNEELSIYEEYLNNNIIRMHKKGT